MWTAVFGVWQIEIVVTVDIVLVSLRGPPEEGFGVGKLTRGTALVCLTGKLG